ncbi:Kelch repeat-containing protein [Sorangium sp. So ce854]|uniref:Kelch repeat-containing protein n=1 Tax=Sorangium sp. So ce854 TaxID=3133322 RepID=UPI003F6354C7
MNGLIRLLAFALLPWCWLAGAACVETTSTLCPNGRRCPAGTFCAANQDICVLFKCGNGIVDGPDEVCDDGNNLDRDGCSADCSSKEKCGDGVLDPKSEACDDGNNVDGDGCQADCTIPLCGDGVLDEEFHEVCDEGPANSSEPDAQCRPNCQPRRCGDGIQDTAEVCDDGNLAAHDGCTPDCQSNETCGNEYIDILLGELCDDGNELSRDGCASSCVTEEPLWTERTFAALSPTRVYAMAYDAARGRVVLFGGKNIFDEPNNETWEWNGVAWARITPTGTAPSARADHAMAYDAARQRVVLFGGFAGGASRDDTWSWDGRTWTQVTPAGRSPAPRHAHAMAYDAARRRIVLFGGSRVPNAGVDDTWEWDGTAWTEIAPAGSSRPSPRFASAMAYDAARERAVLYGGARYNASSQGVSSLGDTWEWDGTTWTERRPAGSSPSSPPWRARHAMAYDAAQGRIVLHDGGSGVWEWDGAAWTERTTAGSSPSSRDNAMVYDVARDRVVLVDYGETWLWDGTGWTERAFADASPGGRYGPAMAYDAGRGRVVLFGSDSANDTWEWDGTTWTERATASSPARGAKIVYDAGRGRTFLHGWGETWEWDGAEWTELTPASSPPTRSRHAMAYDVARRRTVLFGGEFADQARGDTWEWDGADWAQVDVAGPSPPPRYDHAMAYDAERRRVVLFGGRRPAARSDTWEWDGSRWIEQASAGATPSPRHGHAMTYNPARRRVVLFGGFDGVYRADTWEWDGRRWREASLAASPPPGASGAMAYDAVRGRIALFGGGEDFPRSADATWQFSYERVDQIYETCLHGFDNDGDGLIGCSDPDCWGHCAPACPPTSAGECDGSSPRCGDGVCRAELETCVICPQDCGPCPSICGDFICGPGEGCPADCAVQ